MSIANVVRDNMENVEIAASVLEFFQKNDGKRLDKRFLEKLNAAVPGYNFRLESLASMTNLKWGSFTDGSSMLVAYATKHLTADAAFLEERNAGHLSAAVKRNEQREALLRDEAALAELEAAAQQFIAARDKLRSMFEYGAVAHVARFDIEKAYNLNLSDRRD